MAQSKWMTLLTVIFSLGAAAALPTQQPSESILAGKAPVSEQPWLARSLLVSPPSIHTTTSSERGSHKVKALQARDGIIEVQADDANKHNQQSPMDTSVLEKRKHPPPRQLTVAELVLSMRNLESRLGQARTRRDTARANAYYIRRAFDVDVFNRQLTAGTYEFLRRQQAADNADGEYRTAQDSVDHIHDQIDALQTQIERQARMEAPR